MSNKHRGLLFSFISSICFGLLPLLGKTFISTFHPLFVAFVVTGIVDLYFAKLALFRKDLFKNFFHKEIMWVVLIGAFAALGSTLAFFGLLLGKATSAGFLFQFETFFASILAVIFLKEKLNKGQIKGLIFMFVGVYLFSVSFSTYFELGNLFFLGSAFFWGANDIIVKSKLRYFSPFFLAFGRNFFSLPILFLLAREHIIDNLQKVTLHDAIYFLLYGVLSAATVLFLYLAFRHIKTAEATSFQLFSPAITAVGAFFIFGERLSFVQLGGGIIILLGLYLMTRSVRYNKSF